MHRHFSAILLPAFGCLFFLSVKAQEFPAGYSAHVHFGTGVQTRFNQSPDLFFADLRFVPQYTLIKSRLTGGAVGGLFFAEKKISGMAGPTVSVLLRQFNVLAMGTAGNLHLNLQHLWGTGRQHRAGAGLGLDLGNRVVLGLQSYRNYKNGYWVFQSSLGVRVSRVKEPKETFNH